MLAQQHRVIFKYVRDPPVTAIVYLLLVYLHSTAATVCDQIKPHSSPPPNLPDLTLSDTFQVNIEANIVNKGKTVSAKLYYYYPGNIASLKLFENGLDGQIVFNFMADEMYTISGEMCTTGQISTSNYSQWFGVYQSNGKVHINKTQSILHFGNRYGEVFVANETLRGINVMHWKSCAPFPSWNNFTVDYYFSDGNWKTSSTMSSVPVKAEIKGSKTLANGTVYNMHHVYDFYNFRPGIDDEDDTVFQTPKNVYCPGRKQGKPLPALPNRFYYRVERIYTDMAAVSFEDIWYDETYQLFRRDYNPFPPPQPASSLHPITEIHDYKTGVQYSIDQTYGNCSTTALSRDQLDVSLNVTAFQHNGSFILNMKNPLQLFHLDLNYTYIGQYQVRGILCDTYVASTNNFTSDGKTRSGRTVITFYFSAQEWINVFDTTPNIDTSSVPVRMEVFAEVIGFSLTMNFLDFNPNHPSLDVFDIAKCFYEAKKVSFQLKFPGTLVAAEIPYIKQWSHLALAEKMQVSILRVTNLNLDYDDASIFVGATLLDRTLFTGMGRFVILNAAQFTKIPGKKMERQDDEIIYKSSSAVQCASYCVNNPSFICNSFDVCTDDTSCHLSQRHIDDGRVISTVKTCDHFSRNVNGIIPEKSIADAFKLLRESVYSNTLQLNRQGDKVYTAVDVTLTFGWLTPDVKIPTQLSGAYSYEVEVSIPANQQVYTTKVWYDDGFKIIRYDPHYNQAIYPFYTTNPLSIVEDYNTGIKYITDKVYRNCTVTQIAKDDFGANLTPNQFMNSTYKLFIKDPLQLFLIDDTYFFVGQQTVRGMTCNVFESLRTDFVVNNTAMNAIFRYAFLSKDWMEISDGYLGGAMGQPVRLEITVLKPTYYMEYNFYDFDTDHPDMSLFNVPQCYSTQNSKEFQITFPGKYETYLNTSAKMFVIEATFIMSRLSGASVHRFQGTHLDHDKDNIYLTSSLVEQPNKMLYFTRMSEGFVPAHVDKVVPVSQTPDQCAATCVSNSDFVCNSFYICVESNQCLLSKQHAPDSKNRTRTACIAYSRTVDNSTAESSNLLAFLNLQNAVFAKNFTLSIPISGTNENKALGATYIRDVFLTDSLHLQQDNDVLKFNVHSHSTIIPMDISLSYLDIGGCASACLTENTFQCQGFSYCLHDYLCVMSRTHPDQLNNKNIQTRQDCTTYNRQYISDYSKLNGVVSLATSALPFTTTESNEKCAQSCSTNVDCRMFQYCTNTQQCVLYDERTFGVQVNQSLTACNIFVSPYEKDFQSVNAGTFSFTSIVSFQGLTKGDCARYCVQLQKSTCSGFYYDAQTTTCYLPGNAGTVKVNTVGGIFCEQYKRIHFPIHPTSPNTVLTSASTSAFTPASTSTSTRSVPKVTSTTRPSTPTRHSAQTRASPLSPSTSSKTSPTNQVATRTTSSNTGTSSSRNPCSSLQQQTSSNSKHSSGVVAGASVGTFLLGLLLGAVGFYLFRRYRNLDKDELKTNFATNEDTL